MSGHDEDDVPIDRSLLDAAVPGLEPKRGDRARVRRAVLTAIASGAAGAATGTAAGAQAAATATGAAGTTAVGLGLGAKIVLGAIAVASVVSVVAVSTGGMRTDRPAPTLPATSAASIVEVEAPSPTPAVTTASEPLAIEPPAIAPAVEASPPIEAIRSAPISPPPHARTETRRVEEPEIDPIFAETELLARARAAVDAHDGQTALDLLAEHARRFPTGELRQERLATRILALCALGETERAHGEAAAFLDVFPGSVHAAHVRDADCWSTPVP